MTIETLIEYYKKMNRIRLLEERINSEFKKQQMRTPLHSCIGQEAIAVGVCDNLTLHDTIYSNHRSHGHYIAKGGDMKALVAELYNRQTGCSKGRGGSMHIIDRTCGMELTSSIVAGTVPIATGNALAYALEKRNNVSVAFLGDGASEEGCVYESVCFAALRKLPIVYVCENNFYAMYTALEKREPTRRIADKFSNILRTHTADGNDIEKVQKISEEAIAHARNRKGPVFLEFETYRYQNHYESASAKDFWYRDMEEWKAWVEKCPIKRLEQKIIETDENLRGQLSVIDADIIKEIDEAFNFAMGSKYPNPRDLFEGVWA